MNPPLIPLHVDALARLALMYGALIAAAWIVADRLLPAPRGRAAFALAVFVSACSIVVAVETLLGAAGWLTQDTVLLATCAAAVAAIIVKSRKKRAPAAGSSVKDESGTAAGKIACVVFAAAAALMLLLYFIEAAVTPPPPTDAFVYHLYFPAVWLQRGAITFLSRAGGDQASFYYPLNGSLLLLWNMLPLREDTLCNLVQHVSLCACCCAVYATARKLGAGTQPAAAAAALPALTPLFILRSTNSDVDIVFCAFFLAGIYFLLEGRGRVGGGALALSGAAFGLCAGTKSIAALYMLPVIPFIIAEFFRKPGGARAVLVRAAAFLLPAAAMCGYWYARNIAMTGNPLYPLEVKLPGGAVLAGAFGREAMMGSVFHTNSPDVLKETLAGWTFGGGLAVFCAVWAVAGLVLLLLPRPGGKRASALHVLVLAMPFYVLWAYWFVNPNNTATNCRFLMPGVALFFVFVAVSASRIRGGAALAVFYAAAAACAASSALAPDVLEVPLTVLRTAAGSAEGLHRTVRGAVVLWLLAAGAGGAAVMLYMSRRRVVSLPAAAISLVCALLAVNTVYNVSSKTKYYWNSGMELGRIWLTVERATAAAGGTKIAVTGTDACYPLMGFGYRNVIVNIGQDGCVDCPFHIYARRAREARGYAPPRDILKVYKYNYAGADKGAWLRAALAEKPGLLMVFKTGGAFPSEASWADSMPDVFVLKQAGPDMRLYAVKY